MLGLAEELGETDALGLTDSDADPDGDTDALGLTLGEPDADGLREAEGDAEPDGDTDGDTVVIVGDCQRPSASTIEMPPAVRITIEPLP